jgi:hypothetical protein
VRPTRRVFAGAALAAGVVRAAPAFAQVAAAIPQIAPPPPASAGEAASGLRALVARYLAWRGGAALEQLETLHQRFYLEDPDRPSPGQLWVDREGRTRRQVDRAGGREIEVATPDGGWKLGAGGAPVDAPGAFERARRFAALEFGDAFRGRSGASVGPAPPAQMNEHDWAVVRIRFGDADVYDALVDPGAGFLGGYVITEGGVQRTLLFGDWRMVDGVRIPFAQLTKTDPAVELRLAAVELNRPIDPALFAKPAG